MINGYRRKGLFSLKAGICLLICIVLFLQTEIVFADDLELGSKGQEVIELQNYLNENGYSVGTADGDFGKKTEKALKQFQRDHGLSETGILDSNTADVLFGKSKDIPTRIDKMSVQTICRAIMKHYKNVNPDAQLAVFESEAMENSYGYSFPLRSQGGNSANTMWGFLYVNIHTGEVTDDWGDSWFIEPEWHFDIHQAKGKTLIRVEGDPDVLEEGEYRLYVFREGKDVTSKRASKRILSMSNKYKLSFDFSTVLSLESGTYSFTMWPIEKDAPEAEECQFDYYYDENYKYHPEEELSERGDDQFGNEREFRRLVSDSELRPGAKNFDKILDNVRARYQAFGLPKNVIDGIVECLEGCEQVYREVFLYGFYLYTMESSNLFVSQFAPPTLNINKTSKLPFDTDDTVCTIMHETGHALDYYAGGEAYYSVSFNYDAIIEATVYDMRKVAEDAIAQWREREPDSDLNHYSEVQLDQFVSNFYLGKLFSGYTQIDRDFCEDMTNEEYRAYQWVEKNLKNQMPAKHMDTENADMRDALCALAAKEIPHSVQTDKKVVK